MEREYLYMMALVPPEAITDHIEAIRQEFAGAYNCKAALKPPVHITLYPPYKETEAHEKELERVLSRWAKHQVPFHVVLKGYNAFEKNGVIFIDVEKNEQLKNLHKGCTSQMTRLLQPDRKQTQTFHPHITIGYRDIPKERFHEAMNDYLPRKFEASFHVGEIAFWKHNGKHWATLSEFPLKKEDESIRQTTLF